MIVCHSEHSFCTDFSVLELYLADYGKYRSSGYSMHTEKLHTMCSIHTACCRNSKSSMIVWHFEHSPSLCLPFIVSLCSGVSSHYPHLLSHISCISSMFSLSGLV